MRNTYMPLKLQHARLKGLSPLSVKFNFPKECILYCIRKVSKNKSIRRNWAIEITFGLFSPFAIKVEASSLQLLAMMLKFWSHLNSVFFIANSLYINCTKIIICAAEAQKFRSC
jgi:hypothetical protein